MMDLKTTTVTTDMSPKSHLKTCKQRPNFFSAGHRRKNAKMQTRLSGLVLASNGSSKATIVVQKTFCPNAKLQKGQNVSLRQRRVIFD
jgi:hypothetical protein